MRRVIIGPFALFVLIDNSQTLLYRRNVIESRLWMHAAEFLVYRDFSRDNSNALLKTTRLYRHVQSSIEGTGKSRIQLYLTSYIYESRSRNFVWRCSHNCYSAIFFVQYSDWLSVSNSYSSNNALSELSWFKILL